MSAQAEKVGRKTTGDTAAYSVAYRPAKVGAETHFVPAYAAGRPASKCVLDGRHFEPMTHALVAKLFADRPGDMVHAGTFFGDMLPSFSKACPGRVYAFEPVLENYVLAKQCVEANGLANVLLTNAGLGERIDVAYIDTGEKGHRGGASTISERGQPTMLTTIDAYAIADLSVLQLDVEGHEMAALAGARATIERCKPVILVEDKKRQCDEFLEALGYRRAGRLPGIFAWALPQDKKRVRPFIREMRQAEVS
ncbi:FkbM family methyltransferase [Acuticoccus sp. I52.16.1]|uniref:FkbM family methyltransferase n=1 Tax=Acuticoccus sp. I52.16.1 TaxID=2928472 RepID=UPI001FD2811F|nr:FkbM family methyltransferase [Acuticoccus sp. I52.16.1]UOM36306.1 FkbM family methyltransferase [Acuticoccus sp. I52.16.1]